MDDSTIIQVAPSIYTPLEETIKIAKITSISSQGQPKQQEEKLVQKRKNVI